jgi:hypothetical protein
MHSKYLEWRGGCKAPPTCFHIWVVVRHLFLNNFNTHHSTPLYNILLCCDTLIRFRHVERLCSAPDYSPPRRMGSMVVLHRGARHWRGECSKGRPYHSVSTSQSISPSCSCWWRKMVYQTVIGGPFHLTDLSYSYYEAKELTEATSLPSPLPLELL